MTVQNNKDMSPIDFKEVLNKHKGKWVALKPFTNIVVATGKGPRDVSNKAKKKGVETPMIFKATPIKSYFAG